MTISGTKRTVIVRHFVSGQLIQSPCVRPGNCSNALIWSLPARCRRQWYARRSPGRSDQSASSVAIQKYSVITDAETAALRAGSVVAFRAYRPRSAGLSDRSSARPAGDYPAGQCRYAATANHKDSDRQSSSDEYRNRVNGAGSYSAEPLRAARRRR